MVKVPNEAMMHAGCFHTDDVFFAALLKILNTQINIMRCNAVSEGYQGLVFDLCGGEYAYHNNDHLQVRSNGVSWKSILIPIQAKYTIYPSVRGEYNIQAVPVEVGKQECKKLSKRSGEGKHKTSW